MKLKFIAAAVALVASGSSFAFITGPNDGVDAFGTPAELFLTVWQQSGTTGAVNRSFTFDTGVTLVGMQANQHTNLFINQTISGSSEFAAFLAAGSSTAFSYNVSAGDRTDSPLNVLLQTYAGTSVVPKTNLNLANALDAMQGYVGANNATGTHASGAANGWSFNTSNDEYFMSNASNTWLGSTGVNSVAVGTSAMFGEMLQNGDAGGNLTSNTVYAGKMLLAADASNNYVLQYQVQAVPEPTGIALALAGFGLVGGIARRRKSV